MKSSFSAAVCPMEGQRSRMRGSGRTLECRASAAGMIGGQCLLKGFVYTM